MNWYLAKIVFRIVCGEGKHTPQFDEQLRLIKANNEEEAFEKAVSLGKSEEDVFENDERKLVHWTFVNVAELYQLTALIDGAELYSRVKETDNADLYIEVIHKKAAHIQSNITHKLLRLF
jgi:hypothetical protein